MSFFNFRITSGGFVPNKSATRRRGCSAESDPCRYSLLYFNRYTILGQKCQKLQFSIGLSCVYLAAHSHTTMGKRKAEVLEQDLSWEPKQPGIDESPLLVYFSTMLASHLHRGAEWKLYSKGDRRRPPLLVSRVVRPTGLPHPPSCTYVQRN